VRRSPVFWAAWWTPTVTGSPSVQHRMSGSESLVAVSCSPDHCLPRVLMVVLVGELEAMEEVTEEMVVEMVKVVEEEVLEVVTIW